MRLIGFVPLHIELLTVPNNRGLIYREGTNPQGSLNSATCRATLRANHRALLVPFDQLYVSM